MSYSSDFRLCVVQNIMSGMSWDEATCIFGVSRNSIGRWCQKFKATGTLDDTSHRARKARKVDTKQLLALIERDADATLCELAQPFNVAHSVIHYHLRKRGITRKKNQAVSGAGRKKACSI
jgi:transposase